MVAIGFGTNEKWPSRLIRWVTKSPWSHVWIEYKSMTWGGHWMVIHSASDGVVIEPRERVYGRYPKRKMYECEADLTDGLVAIRDHLGAGYDYPAVIWNGLLLVLYTFLRIEWLNQIVLKNGSRFSCSELVATALKAARVKGTEEFEPELMPPILVDQFCASSEQFWVE